ncbi:hypothetical protein GCK32_021356 [Trichostrongylus colubriformis]|uniref:Uncharacterized protein n=1 Tax=Trichostrongylus colubriformis TaxID=6319 RepID=A0AAN8ID42_TRICO
MPEVPPPPYSIENKQCRRLPSPPPRSASSARGLCGRHVLYGYCSSLPLRSLHKMKPAACYANLYNFLLLYFCTLSASESLPRYYFKAALFTSKNPSL